MTGKNELDYLEKLFKQKANLNRILEKCFCDPEFVGLDYCSKYNEQGCPMTCRYAIKMKNGSHRDWEDGE